MLLKTQSTHCFFFNDTATTEIYTLSLHDALPISRSASSSRHHKPTLLPHYNIPHDLAEPDAVLCCLDCSSLYRDRKSTRLNSSHANISYAVFCLKKKHK